MVGADLNEVAPKLILVSQHVEFFLFASFRIEW